MPVIQVNNKQYSLKVGTTLVGAGESADVPVPAHETLGVQAVVEVGSNRSASIRRASPSSAVRVNGVALGVEPIPLLHGDRVEIAGHELLFAEDNRGGATTFLHTHQPAATARPYAGTDVATASTGGRLVSLVDGRDYAISATGIVLGRDAACDVVVARAEVSRRHAEIVPAEAGYVLTDLSTNGVFVNGDRVKYSALLGRGDVIKIGPEEFRFHADDPAVEVTTRSVDRNLGTSTAPREAPSRMLWAVLLVVVAVGAAAFLALR